MYPLSRAEKNAFRAERKYKLRLMIDEWRETFSAALLRVENKRRSEMRMPVINPGDVEILIPQGINADMWMLNIRVWCLRYSVSPEFIIEALTRMLKYMRRKYRTNIIALGLPAHIVGGAKARQLIEDEVLLQYPNNENLKIAQQPEPALVRIKPYVTMDQMVSGYSKAVESAQRKHQRKIRLMSRIPTRPYRQSPKENV
jgi:hypothetical protein